MVSYHAEVDPQLKYEILLRHGLMMFLLTLPSGLVLAALMSLIASLIGSNPGGMTDAFFVSLTCTIAGYWQWLVLLPWLWRKWKAKGGVG